MRLYACPLALLFGLLASTAVSAQTVHDTGSVQFEVFGDGFLGNRGYAPGAGFVFNGENGLFEGQLLVGASFSQTSGQPYANLIGKPPEWVHLSGPVPLSSPFPPPFHVFDEAYEAAYDDSDALSGAGPIGLTVTERSYSSETPPYDDLVVVAFEIENTSGDDRDGLYVGIFADWDVGDFTSNLGGYDADLRLLYVYDASDPGSDYFGVAALDGPVSGWYHRLLDGTNPQWDPLCYGTMTNGGGVIPSFPDDMSTLIGTGPHAIPADSSITIRFAFVAGEDEADLLANTAAAHAAATVAAEPDAEAAGLRLDAPFPNPSRGYATVTFALAEPQAVRLSVYDALGRRVAVLADGMRVAGEHQFAWDGSGLAPGVYVVRLEAGTATLTRRILLMQ